MIAPKCFEQTDVYFDALAIVFHAIDKSEKDIKMPFQAISFLCKIKDDTKSPSSTVLLSCLCGRKKNQSFTWCFHFRCCCDFAIKNCTTASLLSPKSTVALEISFYNAKKWSSWFYCLQTTRAFTLIFIDDLVRLFFFKINFSKIFHNNICVNKRQHGFVASKTFLEFQKKSAFPH